MSRRRLLAGLAGLAAGGTAAQWASLFGSAFGGSGRGEAGAADGARADAVILLFCDGGLSHVDSFDPKPDAPAEYRGEFGSIETAVAGARYCEHLPRLAARADRTALLRSVTHTLGDHSFASRFVLSGEPLASPDTPSMAAVAAFRWPPSSFPTYAAIPSIGPSAGDLGAEYEAYNVLGDGGALIAEAPRTGEGEGLALYERRGSLRRRLNERFFATVADDRLEAWDATYEQAAKLMESDALRGARNLTAEPEAVRDRYGRFAWGEYALIARRMVEAGSRFVVAQSGGWDTHRKNFTVLERKLPEVDQAAAALIDDLEDRGLLERTLVVLLSEFGRTPRVNDAAGRDHWPQATSVLWAGGGIAGGRVIGATDARAAEVVDRPVSPEDVAFTILHQLGLDPGELMLPPHGRKLLPTGRQILELTGRG